MSFIRFFETDIFQSIELMFKVITEMSSLSHLMEDIPIYFIQLCFNHFSSQICDAMRRFLTSLFWANFPGREGGGGVKGGGKGVWTGHFILDIAKWPLHHLDSDHISSRDGIAHWQRYKLFGTSPPFSSQFESQVRDFFKK